MVIFTLRRCILTEELYGFTLLVCKLDIPGEIFERRTYEFEFSAVEIPYGTHNGVNVRLSYAGSIEEYQDFVVCNYTPQPSINNSMKIPPERCNYWQDILSPCEDQNKEYGSRDKMKRINWAGANNHVETETLAKFELMYGPPVRGESILIRLFLGPYELTLTHWNVNNKFSAKHYLNLVLVDEDDCRYFNGGHREMPVPGFL